MNEILDVEEGVEDFNELIDINIRYLETYNVPWRLHLPSGSDSKPGAETEGRDGSQIATTSSGSTSEEANG